MKRKYDQIYQFKITLRGSKPSIWRRIQVPEIYSFWDLHVAIQDAMGWDDCHLHQFEMVNPSTGSEEEIGIPDEDSLWGRKVHPGWKRKIADYFTMNNSVAAYEYDFGDSWEHIVKLENILPRVKGVKYPICIKGKRRCPHEDCGGVWGYMDILEIMNNPDHEEYEDMKEWLGDEFDPEYFDAKETVFDDPDVRRKMMF